MNDNQSRSETVPLMQEALATLLGSITIKDETGAACARAIAKLNGNMANEIIAGTFAADFLKCFALASTAGATYDGLDVVRSYLVGLDPVSELAQAAVQFAVQITLGAMSRIAADMVFPSRDSIETMMQRIATAFEQAEDAAADFGSAEAYQTLIGLHAAIINHLATAQRPLPRMITYSVGLPLPSVVLAYRLYGDASRGDELAAENGVSNPCFMPLTGNCLSN